MINHNVSITTNLCSPSTKGSNYHLTSCWAEPAYSRRGTSIAASIICDGPKLNAQHSSIVPATILSKTHRCENKGKCQNLKPGLFCWHTYAMMNVHRLIYYESLFIILSTYHLVLSRHHLLLRWGQHIVTLSDWMPPYATACHRMPPKYCLSTLGFFKP